MEPQNVNIKAIDKTTVHRICSGQVVLNLATAVKELVENSIDAGATAVDVKLKEYGSELIEVSDNGHGVHPDNFEGLTLKHHTSKLRDFSDLVGVETFGFRGEALSSLCALSDISVITRHTSQECGTHLIFDGNGHISQQTQCARQVGTSVILGNLFKSLPVRQKEFHKNLKREFNKMNQLLFAYCLVSTKIKITCINQTGKGNRTTLVSTQGCPTVKENISCVFGPKQLNNLLEFKVSLPSDELMTDLKFEPSDCDIFKFEGYISSCAHGSGRSAADRQFYFINSRPCEPSKVMKTVNETYHQYNIHQFPFVYLNIIVAKESVDINVTPDKRQIFLDREKLLAAIIKASLQKMYETIPSTFSMNNVPERRAQIPIKVESKPNLSLFSQWRHKTDGKRSFEDQQNETNSKVIKQDKQKGQCTLDSFSITKRPKLEIQNVITESPETTSQVIYTESKSCATSSDRTDITLTTEVITSIETNTFETIECTEDKEVLTIRIIEPDKEDTGETVTNDTKTDLIDLDCSTDKLPNQTPNEPDQQMEDYKLEVENCLMDNPCANGVNDSCLEISRISEENSSSQSSQIFDKVVIFDSYIERGKKYVDLSVDISQIKKKSEFNANAQSNLTSIRFRAAIDPSKNDQAENELKKEISKEMFQQMEIVGQFNLGFIITRLNSDLFIVDQHATDEKYNFETLQKTTVINNQKLVIPKPLDLTAANESILFDNLEIFKKNGFEFKIDDNAPPTKRVCLSAVPMSRNWVFGKEDIDELLFMLQENSNTNIDCRPSRVRAMFASRACRKSVMIGTPLNKKEMKRLITQMGTIEHPWNCPHGRPTMRHLVNLDLMKPT